jgi:cation/acetate symporter
MNAISAGVFGVPVGIATIVIVSLLTAPPEKEVQELVEHVRYPNLTGDIDTRGA